MIFKGILDLLKKMALHLQIFVVFLEHVYMRPEISVRLHANSHGDFTAATFETIARLAHVHMTSFN